MRLATATPSALRGATARADLALVPKVFAQPTGAIGAPAERCTGSRTPYGYGESVYDSADLRIAGALAAGYSPTMNERTKAGARATNGGVVRDASTSSPALRDADAILARAADDEAAALVARDRYRDGAVEPIEPDERIAALLVPGEKVFAVRRSALLDRREPQPSAYCPGCPGLAGDLYVTSTRVVHLGRLKLEYDLDSIREAVVSAERLLLLCDGGGLILDVDRPRLLRVDIAAARARHVASPCAARAPGLAPRTR
jgi:hypothetical protein